MLELSANGPQLLCSQLWGGPETQPGGNNPRHGQTTRTQFI